MNTTKSVLLARARFILHECKQVSLGANCKNSNLNAIVTCTTEYRIQLVQIMVVSCAVIPR